MTRDTHKLDHGRKRQLARCSECYRELVASAHCAKCGARNHSGECKS